MLETFASIEWNPQFSWTVTKTLKKIQEKYFDEWITRIWIWIKIKLKKKMYKWKLLRRVNILRFLFFPNIFFGVSTWDFVISIFLCLINFICIINLFNSVSWSFFLSTFNKANKTLKSCEHFRRARSLAYFLHLLFLESRQRSVNSQFCDYTSLQHPTMFCYVKT